MANPAIVAIKPKKKNVNAAGGVTPKMNVSIVNVIAGAAVSSTGAATEAIARFRPLASSRELMSYFERVPAICDFTLQTGSI